MAGFEPSKTQLVYLALRDRIANGHTEGQGLLPGEQYVGSGVYLFASVLERFLGLYSSLNSFTQLVARTRQRKEPLKRWPPRAGEQILL